MAQRPVGYARTKTRPSNLFVSGCDPTFGDEMVIENPGMSRAKPRVTAEDLVMLREMRIGL